MSNTVVYSAINTKIRVLERKFLRKKDYQNLLKMATVSDAAAYLKENTYYSNLLTTIDTDMVSRRDIEGIFKVSMAGNIDKLIYFFHNDYKKLIHFFFLKYEIEDLKSLARRIFNGQDPQEIKKSLFFLGKFSKTNAERLMEAKTIRDLIYSLKGAYFYEFLIPLVDGRRENLFRFEMALDFSYFSNIQRRKLRISSRDSFLIKEYEGLLADLYNIQWIYRGKKFYQLSPAELLNYTINFGVQLTYQDRQKMCYATSLGNLYRLTLNSAYGFLFKKEEISTDIYMERRINNYIYYQLRKLNHKFPLSIMQTINYIWTFELEIKNIISIIESIRYNLTAQDAVRFVVKVV